jgi:hypothetical protein
MKPTIVTVEGGEEGSEVTFEQAFGEFSELRGRGRERRRKRRQERRMKRIRDRQERKRARQEMRGEQQEARQVRQDKRKSRRVARKAMGDEPESEEQGEGGSGDGGGQGDGGSGDGGGQGDGGSPPINQEGDSTQDNQGGGQGEYQGEGGGYSSDDEGQNPDGADAFVDSQTGESDEESGFTGDSNFDGEIMMSPEDAEWNEYFSSAEGLSKINPKVKRLALLIEKEKHFIGVLNKKLDKFSRSKMQGSNRAVAMLRKRLAHHTARLKRMEMQLASYSKFDGDYSEARGGRRAVARKKAEVRRAKKEARKLRKQAIRSRRRGTDVESDLNPELSEQRIEVPAESSNFNGTGLIGLDEQGDVDAPETRKFDLIFSNAEGDEAKKKKRNKIIIGVSIGVAVGVLAIILIKKFGKK